MSGGPIGEPGAAPIRRRPRRRVWAAFLVLALVVCLIGCSLDWGVEDYATDGCSCDAAPVVPQFWRGGGKTDVTFIAFGDPQFYEEGVQDRNTLQVRAINAAEERLTWGEAFGLNEPVAKVRGVIIAGDLTQNGRDGRLWEWDEYAHFVDCYGLCGNRAVRYPVYEGYGNHDFYIWNNPLYRVYAPHPVADAVSIRNARRPGVIATASGKDGHYAWEWDNVHFVHLNLKPSDVPGEARGSHDEPVPGALDPRHALTFLKQDLAEHVAGTGKLVVIVAHYGFFAGWDFDGWWTPEEAEEFHQVIQGYDVVAYLHGHDHGTQAYTWNGIQVLDVGSPYYDSYNEAGRGHFTVVRIMDGFLYAGDASWDPADPEGTLLFPAGWHVKVALDK